MDIKALLKFFTPEEVVKILKGLPPLKTPVMDLVYPESRRRQKASSYIALNDIKDRTGALPVVRKDTRSVPLSAGGGASIFEPEGFFASIFVKAGEMNNLIHMGQETGVQAFVADAIETLRDECRRGTEILAAQSLSGLIDYPMATDAGGFIHYEVEYGTIKTLAAASIPAANMGALITALEEQHSDLANRGYAGDIRFLCAPDVFTGLVNFITGQQQLPPVNWNADGFTLLGKYKISSFGSTYVKPGQTAATPIVETGHILAIDISAQHTLFYCALDDLSANLAPLPFYAKPVYTEEPSGVKILGMSKPIPAPVLGAINKRQVTFTT